jgi:hypothetical protein
MSTQTGIIRGVYNHFKSAIVGGQNYNPLSPGTRVTVIGETDGWLEIQTLEQGEQGFTKRENVYLIPEEGTPSEGGTYKWTVKAEFIYDEASRVSHNGSINTSEIPLATGQTRVNENEPHYKNWSEISILRFNREYRGWFPSDLLDEYIPADETNDPSNPELKDTVFQEPKNLLYTPTDQEIQEAIEAPYRAAQYINVRPVIGRDLIHYHLCGEFCVAAIVHSNVIPALQRWCGVDERARAILENAGEGTYLKELEDMLAIYELAGESLKSDYMIPISPGRLAKRLNAGECLLVGVGIETVHGSLVPKVEQKARHWVVVEEVLPVANNGWIRLYNPFNNRDEVYTYDAFMESMGTGVGLWVRPKAGIEHG